MTMPTVLQEIVAQRKARLPEIAERTAHVDQLRLQRSDRSLEEALRHNRHGGVRLIMECKSASPSLGQIRADYQPGQIARIYSRYAAAISVLCEPDRFNGDYNHLAAVRANTHLPVLCKDFIIDPVQIIAARYFGADAILLMLSILSDEEYRNLAKTAADLGLDVLTEVIDEEEVARATKLGARIIGINHRNLHTLEIDLSRSAKLAPLIPAHRVIVAESGIRTNQTLRQLSPLVDGFLIGSSLTGSANIDAACRALVYGSHKVCGLTNAEEAQVAAAAGATYGGLIFQPESPRNVTPELASTIIDRTPGLKWVAVTRNLNLVSELPVTLLNKLTAVQLHDPVADPTAEVAFTTRAHAAFPDLQIWRAIDMTAPDADQRGELIHDRVDMCILDTGSGGTGTTFDWNRIPECAKDHSLLAGGLNLDNLNDALSVGTLGLDLNSGLEYPAAAGRYHYFKDAGKILAAFSQIRAFPAPHPRVSSNTER